jgi:hypothetical protein
LALLALVKFLLWAAVVVVAPEMQHLAAVVVAQVVIITMPLQHFYHQDHKLL